MLVVECGTANLREGMFYTFYKYTREILPVLSFWQLHGLPPPSPIKMTSPCALVQYHKLNNFLWYACMLAIACCKESWILPNERSGCESGRGLAEIQPNMHGGDNK